MTKLKSKVSGEIYDVQVSSITDLGKNSVTGNTSVIFGKINGKGKEYAFKIPNKYLRM